jgi:hypothetical protein
MQKQNIPKRLIYIIIIFVSIMLLGIGLGFLYSSLPEHQPEISKETGEICTDGGQCVSGVCFPPTLTDAQKISLTNGPLKNIVGTCYAEDSITGCIEQVVRGEVSRESMCLEK